MLTIARGGERYQQTFEEGQEIEWTQKKDKMTNNGRPRNTTHKTDD